MQKYSHLKNISLVGVWLLFCSDSCSLSKMLLPSVWGCCFVNDNSLTYAARQLMLTANHTPGVWWRGWIDVSCWRSLTPSTPLSFALEATSSLINVKKSGIIVEKYLSKDPPIPVKVTFMHGPQYTPWEYVVSCWRTGPHKRSSIFRNMCSFPCSGWLK